MNLFFVQTQKIYFFYLPSFFPRQDFSTKFRDEREKISVVNLPYSLQRFRDEFSPVIYPDRTSASVSPESL